MENQERLDPVPSTKKKPCRESAGLLLLPSSATVGTSVKSASTAMVSASKASVYAIDYRWSPAPAISIIWSAPAKTSIKESIV